MKKNLIKMLLAAIVVASGVNIYNSQKENGMSDIALANVEALAEGEVNWCSNNCKEWRGSSGGGIACDCGRYTGRCKNYC